MTFHQDCGVPWSSPPCRPTGATRCSSSHRATPEAGGFGGTGLSTLAGTVTSGETPIVVPSSLDTAGLRMPDAGGRWRRRWSVVGGVGDLIGQKGPGLPPGKTPGRADAVNDSFLSSRSTPSTGVASLLAGVGDPPDRG